MDLEQIEKLMEAMQEAQIKRLSIKRDGFEIELERETKGGEAIPVYHAAPQMSTSYHSPQVQESSAKPAPAKETTPSHYVTSPIVGTFYLAPSPEDPPFVKIGDHISENSVMCIIEAMKVMNEVKAGIKGKVVEILLKNGDPVEFGTKIFRIEV